MSIDVTPGEWLDAYFPNADYHTLADLHDDMTSLRPRHRTMKGYAEGEQQGWIDDLAHIIHDTAHSGDPVVWTVDADDLANYISKYLGE